jgi:hypothetical protein
LRSAPAVTLTGWLYCAGLCSYSSSTKFTLPTSGPFFQRFIALFAWSLAIWIAWNPLIDIRQESHASPRSKQTIGFIGKLLFGIYLCAALLLFEKFSIQWIAGKFHQRSYAGQGIFCVLCSYTLPESPVERIANQKFAVKTLTTLYRHSTELAENPDSGIEKHAAINPTRFVKQALKGVRFAATTTTTALGNVASEIAGRCAHLVPLQPENPNIQTVNFISSVLQPNSPQAMVLTAIESAHKTKLVRITNPSMSYLP